MPFIFGYGSLINPASASKTLGRALCHDDFVCATLDGYLRSWTAGDDICLLSNGVIQPCRALFLDLTASPGHCCNGAAIQVNETELAALDTREQGYQRYRIHLQVAGHPALEAYTYMIPACSKQYDGIIPARYKRMIDEALADFPAGFADSFWQSTQASPATVVEGEYIFENCVQNKVAGRTLISDD